MGNDKKDKRRKTINFLLLVLTVLAGLLWGITGEDFLSPALHSLDGIVIVGAYYTVLFLFTIAACLVSEHFVSSLVSRYFFRNFTLWALKFSVPAALGTLFAAAALFQFVYGLDIKRQKTITPAGSEKYEVVIEETIFNADDFYFVVDDSSSMQASDPDFQRVVLLSGFVDRMSEQNRVSLVRFDETASVLENLTRADEEGKKRFKDSIQRFASEGASTDIVGGLDKNARLLDNSAGRKGITVLVTDGAQGFDYSLNVLDAYITEGVPVYTLFMGEEVPEIMRFLAQISPPTGGKVVFASNFADFERELTRIVTKTDERVRTKNLAVQIQTRIEPVRNLLTRRDSESSPLPGSLGFWRIIFITALGVIFAWLVVIVFQYRPLTVPFVSGGLFSGLAAGIVMEVTIQSGAMAEAAARTLHNIILAALMWTAALFTSLLISKLFNREPLEWFMSNGHVERLIPPVKNPESAAERLKRGETK